MATSASSDGREAEILAVLDTFYSHFDGEEWERVAAMETEVVAIAREMCANPAWPDNVAGGIYSQLAETFTALGQSDRAAEMQGKADAIVTPVTEDMVAEAVAEEAVAEEGDGGGITCE